jgi:flagellar hook-basal body protein
MSFYTSLTGLNAATAQLGVTSNNIANVGTTGFKRSRADFGDIFATSPLQKASSTIGQGVALKQVTQEFGQGNVAFSANALDLAVTGDGFFPLKSADGLQDIYTRNGSFMMNDQYNVVNSAGQRLMAASVDSSGKADLSDLNVLTIPQQTNGEAAETSLINLGLNFPADATVITDTFSRNNPATYNKSTAMTVYDSGGNGYLATVYYSKTQNASQLSPTNKWQTNVFVGDTQVNPSLIQATDVNGEELYVNKYGEIQPLSAVGDLLVNGKTQMFSLDDLTDTRISQPAAIKGIQTSSDLTADTTYNFSSVTASDLESMFTIDIDDSGVPVTLDLSHLAGSTTTMTGVDIAKEMTNVLNAEFGDERYFDFTSNTTFQLNASVGGVAKSVQLDISNLGSFKQETLTFTAPTAGASQSFTVAGVTVNLASTDVTAAQVAAQVKVDLDASNFITASSSVNAKTIVDNGDGTLTLKWNVLDVAADNVVFADANTTGVTGTSTVLAPYTADISDITKVRRGDAVDAMQAAVDAAGLTTVTVGFDAVNRGFTFSEADSGAISLQAPQSRQSFDVTAGSDSLQDVSVTLTESDGTVVSLSISNIDIGTSGVQATEDAAALASMVTKFQAATGYSSSGYTISSVDGALSFARNDGAAFTTLFAAGSSGYDGGLLIGATDQITGAVTTSVTASSVNSNSVLGLSAAVSAVGDNGLYTPIGTSLNGQVSPNGGLVRTLATQRYGMNVTFDNVNEQFSFSSGSTGDASSITITDSNSLALSLLGISATAADPLAVATSDTALRGTVSSPAVTTGTQVAINVNNNFSVDSSNNTFVVSVDDVKGTVTLPASDSYTLDGFMLALEKEINTLASDTGSSTSGVTVSYDQVLNAFKFTTGTSGTDSFIKVSGSSNWGLANVDAGRGTTSSWIKPTQFQEVNNGVSVSKYIDEFGVETTSADGFTVLPEWSPIYLDKGELTFNTSGNLISPQTGSQLDTVYLADGKGALTINIDYSASTQYSSAFAVLSQSQDGRPEGDLVGLDIGDDGLVSASYSNGTQNTLAKVILANFSSPAGLRQIGNSSFYSTAKSGNPKIGEAGSAGFGTVRAGATERANVDLTQELVDLITAQRNFQANSKAIETSSTMTQAIINIRS